MSKQTEVPQGKEITTMLQFGVGHCVAGTFIRENGNWRSLQAVTIRRWNTTSGLGELGDGPAKATLDPIPYGLEIPDNSVVGAWRLSEAGVKAWKKELDKVCPARVLDSF